MDDNCYLQNHDIRKIDDDIPSDILKLPRNRQCFDDGIKNFSEIEGLKIICQIRNKQLNYYFRMIFSNDEFGFCRTWIMQISEDVIHRS